MDKVTEAREKMVERVKAAEILKSKTKDQQDCEHNYITFKETIHSNNGKFKKTSAFFKVLGCLKCHDKKRIHLVVE